MSSLTISTTEWGVDQPSRSRSGDTTRIDRGAAPPAPSEVEVGDADGVDVVDLAVVDILLGQLGVVQGEERTEHRVVGSADCSELTQSIERLGDVGMGLHRQPPTATTLSRLSAAAVSESTRSVGWTDRRPMGGGGCGRR